MKNLKVPRTPLLRWIDCYTCIPMNIFSELSLETHTFSKKYDELGNFGQNTFVNSRKFGNLIKAVPIAG